MSELESFERGWSKARLVLMIAFALECFVSSVLATFKHNRRSKGKLNNAEKISWLVSASGGSNLVFWWSFGGFRKSSWDIDQYRPLLVFQTMGFTMGMIFNFYAVGIWLQTMQDLCLSEARFMLAEKKAKSKSRRRSSLLADTNKKWVSRWCKPAFCLLPLFTVAMLVASVLVAFVFMKEENVAQLDFRFLLRVASGLFFIQVSIICYTNQQFAMKAKGVLEKLTSMDGKKDKQSKLQMLSRKVSILYYFVLFACLSVNIMQALMVATTILGNLVVFEVIILYLSAVEWAFDLVVLAVVHVTKEPKTYSLRNRKASSVVPHGAATSAAPTEAFVSRKLKSSGESSHSNQEPPNPQYL